MTDDDDREIAQYRNQLVAEAELARGDLDEIEDHLRSLAGELRDAGMPRALAITEACRRLGDPKHVAREHARVRSPFGAKLSRARAWSAAALIVGLVGYEWYAFGKPGPILGGQFALAIVIALALAARLSWARPMALGGAASFGLVAAFFHASSPVIASLPYAGIIAFVAPWRRGELTAGGLALALQTWAFGAAAYGLRFGFSHSGSHVVHALPSAEIAFLAAIVAVCGGVLRGRWGALASAVSAVTLGIAASQFAMLWVRVPGIQHFSVASLAGGAIAATIATVLAWRGARSLLGSLQSVRV